MRDSQQARPWLVSGAGALAAGLSTAILSTDWCWTTLEAALIGAIAGRLIEAAPRSGRVDSWRPRLWVRLTGTVVIGLALGIFFRLDKATMFERAFGAQPPPGVTNLKIERHYAGGPGDEVMLIRFFADQAAMQQLLSQGTLKEDKVAIELLWSEQNWSTAWENLFSHCPEHFGGRDWNEVEPITSPKVYVGAPRNAARTTLLWDPASGRAYAVYTVG